MKINKISIILWILAIFVIFLVIYILGWKAFYGYVIPQAGNITTLSLIGVVGFAFIAGILSFFSPCPFAVFPAYVAFFLSSNEEKGSSKIQAFKFAGKASAGIIVFYIILGIILASLGTQLAFYTNYLKLGAIAFIFIFGLILLTGKQIPTGFIDQWINKYSLRFKSWGAFGYGIVYAIAGAACFLPVILTISLIPIISGNFMVGFLAFIIYGLAISLMLTVATLIVASGKQKLLKSFVEKSDLIKKLSGIILIGSAVFLISFYLRTGM